jgi:hypothetical protein
MQNASGGTIATNIVTMNLSLKQQREIRELLATRHRDQVVKRFREITGCDVATAEAEIDAMASGSSAGEVATAGHVRVDESRSRGSAWTLIVAIMVFVAILGTVYLYLFPRLRGEYVAATSTLELRAIGSSEETGSLSLTLPDGSKVNADDKPLLKAADFSVFRGDEFQQPASLTLYFSESGRERLKTPEVMAAKEQVVILNGRAIARTRSAEWTETSMIIELPGLSSSDANEIFARLTQ